MAPLRIDVRPTPLHPKRSAPLRLLDAANSSLFAGAPFRFAGILTRRAQSAAIGLGQQAASNAASCGIHMIPLFAGRRQQLPLRRCSLSFRRHHDVQSTERGGTDWGRAPLSETNPLCAVEVHSTNSSAITETSVLGWRG